MIEVSNLLGCQYSANKNMRFEISMFISIFISSEDINDIIKIIKSLEDSNVLIDVYPEAVKHETKNKKAEFFLLC